MTVSQTSLQALRSLGSHVVFPFKATLKIYLLQCRRLHLGAPIVQQGFPTWNWGVKAANGKESVGMILISFEGTDEDGKMSNTGG